MSEEAKKEVGFVTTDQIQEIFNKHFKYAKQNGINEITTTAVVNKLSYMLGELFLRATENEESEVITKDEVLTQQDIPNPKVSLQMDKIDDHHRMKMPINCKHELRVLLQRDYGINASDIKDETLNQIMLIVLKHNSKNINKEANNG